MSQTLINTLRFADRLKEAGFAGAQAEALARVLGDELTEQLPSKADFTALQTDFKTLEDKFGRLEDKFDALEGRFDALEGKFGILEGRFDALGEKAELDEVFARADFVSLHPPLIPQTRGMMNDAAFSRMKRTAFLVNCSRGPIVDTDALVRALDSGEIAGCALDTTDPEPLPDPHPLRGRENVIINPHAAWYSEQSMVGLQQGAPNEVRRVLSGEWPLNVVNREVKGKSRAGL